MRQHERVALALQYQHGAFHAPVCVRQIERQVLAQVLVQICRRRVLLARARLFDPRYQPLYYLRILLAVLRVEGLFERLLIDGLLDQQFIQVRKRRPREQDERRDLLIF